MINNYDKLIYQVTNKFDKQYQGDLWSECYIQIHDGIKRFDSTKGKFETFIYKRLLFTCRDYVKSFNQHDSLNQEVSDEEGETVEAIDLLKSELNLEQDVINSDYINKHNNNLTPIESFIQDKYYIEGMTMKAIIDVYQPYTMVKSENTIRKILKK